MVSGSQKVKTGSGVNFRIAGILFLSTCLFTFSYLPLKAMGKDTILRTYINKPVTVTFTASRAYPDPANQVIIDVIFTDPKGLVLRVPANWDGNNRWKVSYISALPGTHAFISVCSESNDSGLNGIKGKVIMKLPGIKSPSSTKLP